MVRISGQDSAPIVEMVGVARDFAGPPDVHALRAIDLTITRGEYLAILGRSGSGKSTLLNLIGLLDRPTSGEYTFDGISTTDMTEAGRTSLRGRAIGFVFQDFQLLAHRTAIENVVLGRTYVDGDRRRRVMLARSMLIRVGLRDRLHALPGTMSGGERQRVAIARALVSEPDLLLCDEPTGNLDSATAGEILDLLDELNLNGATVVVITHDSSTASRAARRLSIRDGQIESLVLTTDN